MLTVSQCKEYLDPQTLQEMSDDEIIQIRDILYGIAKLAMETLGKNKNMLKLESVNNSSNHVL